MSIARAPIHMRLLVPALLAALLVACSSSDDDPPATAAGSMADIATSTSETELRPTAAADDDATATSDNGAAPTATSATEDSTAGATAAASDTTATGGDSSASPLGELADITVELPNYSMRAVGTLDLGEEDGPEAFVLDIQQSSAENYYFTVTIGEDLIEYWLVDESFYVSFDGADTQSIPYTPDMAQGPFTPGYYLVELQDPEQYIGAECVGEEELNGRVTTHYRYSAADWAAATEAQGTPITDVGGEGGELWVDNELNVIIRATADLAWTDEISGERFEQQMTWDVFDIGSTAAVSAPS